MKIIGITGGIGSGKSTVVRFLAELGAVVIDADKVGHDVLRSDGRIKGELVAAFGGGILTPHGHISREKLGKLVFGDPQKLKLLNRIIHPEIDRRVMALIAKYRREEVGVLAFEAPLLFDVGWEERVDEVWVTVAAEATVLQRLDTRTGFSREQALARIRAQSPPEELAGRADVVIDTDCPLAELRDKVFRLWDRVAAGTALSAES
jgi:dephospho-CoA kinase